MKSCCKNCSQPMKFYWWHEKLVCPVCNNTVSLNDYRWFKIYKVVNIIILLMIYNLCIVPIMDMLCPNLAKLARLFIHLMGLALIFVPYYKTYKYVLIKMYNKFNSK